MKDDAVVYNWEDGSAVISTTDFFTPIVDDPFDFGFIAATNALSDVYAMGGAPLVAIAMRGWPLDKISTEIASVVLDGARGACKEAGIQLAGGHSIDTEEPIFGLAVTGRVQIDQLKKNSTAKAGDAIYLTKPLGVGIITTAQKKGMVMEADLQRAKENMMLLNTFGSEISSFAAVDAMTDVTGFGLLGHLTEMCVGSDLTARISLEAIPLLPNIDQYIEKECIPGGTWRNWKSYATKVDAPESVVPILADPQTSGGLLIAVRQGAENDFEIEASKHGLDLQSIGVFEPKGTHCVIVQ
jgi:selenide,water dikinase